jgi:hypothetical protein
MSVQFLIHRLRSLGAVFIRRSFCHFWFLARPRHRLIPSVGLLRVLLQMEAPKNESSLSPFPIQTKASPYRPQGSRKRSSGSNKSMCVTTRTRVPVRRTGRRAYITTGAERSTTAHQRATNRGVVQFDRHHKIHAQKKELLDD